MRGSGARFLPANISMVSEIDKLFCVFYPRNLASLRKYKQTWSVYDTEITLFFATHERPSASALKSISMYFSVNLLYNESINRRFQVTLNRTSAWNDLRASDGQMPYVITSPRGYQGETHIFTRQFIYRASVICLK